MKIPDKICEVQLRYKTKVKASDRPVISSSRDAYKLFVKHIFSQETIEYKEYVKIILLNTANKVLGVSHLSEGGQNSTVLDIRHVLQSALLSNAAGIIIAHNHPSGSCKTGQHDDSMTERLKRGCEAINIRLLDHIIITKNDYYSYADNGKI